MRRPEPGSVLRLGASEAVAGEEPPLVSRVCPAPWRSKRCPLVAAVGVAWKSVSSP